ncbi:hypothetical protein ACEN32_02420 [Marinilactibacillus psychrotolerans]|uniref:hypothetical protein n=1 Tax=Marinilactibacillus psychrotolerans TaxID=191770 RepID=UPI00388AD961
MDIFKFQQDQPRTFLENTFSKEERIYFNSCTKLGYEMALDTFRKDSSWLLKYRGESILPRVKTIAVEYMLVQYIKNGLIDLDYSIQRTSNNRNTFMLFSNANKNVNLIANQTSNENKPSNFARYRAEKHNNFQSYFDFDNYQLTTDQPTYFELNHGYQTEVPAFTMLGIPKSISEWYVAIPLHKEELILTETKQEKFVTVQNELSDFDITDFEEFVREKEN